MKKAIILTALVAALAVVTKIAAYGFGVAFAAQMLAFAAVAVAGIVYFLFNNVWTDDEDDCENA